ncbi:MAG: ComEC/Rec2 family competence protein [Treponema sp.]|nr:ComEC/Rec2 family competence protein [Treponema sp.]
MVSRIFNFKNISLPPVQCAAVGAVAGFYLFFNLRIALIITVISILLAALCLLRVLSSVDPDSRKLRLFSTCAAALTFGAVLGVCAANAGKNEIKFGIPENKITAIEGVMLEDPRIISSGSAMVSVSLRACTAGSAGKGTSMKAGSSGEVTVFFQPENAEKLKQFGRGTVIFAEGALRSSQRGYSFSAKSLHITNRAPSVEKMRTNIRLGLIKRFEKEKWGGLALALLLGVRDNLDTEFTTQYRNAGLSYILALSGMHLAIIAALISFLLKKPLGLNASLITGAVIIILYCLLVGPMPSLNRSALMYVLGVLAVLGSLPKKAMSVLSLSFLIQIIVTPAAGNTLSFILSYAALLGILITGKAFASIFKGMIPDFVLQPLSLSTGAFLATAGICGFVFGMIAPMGIITGLAVAPLTTVFMIGSIIWLALDFISLSFLLSFPLFIVYRLMEIIASVAGNIPGLTGNPALMLVMSIILSLAIIVYEQRRRSDMLRLDSFL